MKLLVCGSRTWDDIDYIEDVLVSFWKQDSKLEIIEGGARGADLIAKQWANRMNLHVTEIKPDWNRYGLSAGPRRNKQMINLNPDFCLAFHNDIDNSKGTKDMIEKAKYKKILVSLYYVENDVRKVRNYYSHNLHGFNVRVWNEL